MTTLGTQRIDCAHCNTKGCDQCGQQGYYLEPYTQADVDQLAQALVRSGLAPDGIKAAIASAYPETAS